MTKKKPDPKDLKFSDLVDKLKQMGDDSPHDDWSLFNSKDHISKKKDGETG